MNDRKFFFAIFVIEFLLLLPFLYGLWLARSPELSYTGAHVLTPGDYPVYLNYIQQVKDGNVVFENFYTSEPFPSIFNPFWFAAGSFAAAASLAPALAFHGLRVILGAVFLWMMWRLAQALFSGRRQQWFFFALLLSGGVGTFYNAFISSSQNFLGYYDAAMDLWVPEAFGWLMLGNSPHIIASVILMVIAFVGFALAIERHVWKYAVVSGLASLLMFSFHPFHVPLVWGVEAVALLLWWGMRRRWSWKEAGMAATAWVISVPSVVYHVVLMLTQPRVAERAGQNLLFSPSLPLFLASYGVLGLLGVIGGVIAWRKAKTSFLWVLLLTWLITQPFFFFSPLDWQRRLTQGWFIPLAIFGAFALERVVRWWLKSGAWQPARWIEMGMLALLLLYFSPLYVWLYDFNYLKNAAAKPNEQSRSFLTSDDRELFGALRLQTTESDVVLADLTMSNVIPGTIGRRVFVGHGVETLEFERKFFQSVAFFEGRGGLERLLRFLNDEGITTVVFRTSEHANHPLFNDFPHRVFENEMFRVWQRRSAK